MSHSQRARRRLRLRLPVPMLLLLGLLPFSGGSDAQPQPTQSQAAPAEPPAPIAGAIYFDPWQLEKEFLVSPLTLQEWIELDLAEDTLLDSAARSALRPKIGKFLVRHCPVLIEGREVEFSLDRIHFIEPDQQEFKIIEEDAIVSAKDVRVSVVFAAPNNAPDKVLQLLWSLFPEGMDHVAVRAADISGSRLFKVRRGTPTVSVQGRYELGARELPPPPEALPPPQLKVPLLSILLLLGALVVLLRTLGPGKTKPASLVVPIVLAGAAAASVDIAALRIPHPLTKTAPPDAEQSKRIMHHLLRTVYHAFDFRDEEKQYDVLAEAVAGPALTDIYLEVRRTLESRQRDGARVRVQDLSIAEVEPIPLDNRPGFESECRWEVRGRVGHWGHFHNRINRYHATFVLESHNARWKITELRLHSRHRDADPGPASGQEPRASESP